MCILKTREDMRVVLHFLMCVQSFVLLSSFPGSDCWAACFLLVYAGDICSRRMSSQCFFVCSLVFLLLYCDFSTYPYGSTNLLGDWLSLLCYCPIHNLFTIWTDLSQLSLLVKAIQSAVCVAINWPAARFDCVNISH
jgi:hypothetical protein